MVGCNASARAKNKPRYATKKSYKGIPPPPTMPYLSMEQAEEMYDDMIDEIYGEVKVGVTFNASRVLKELDPIAYRCGFNDYMDSLFEDGYTLMD